MHKKTVFLPILLARRCPQFSASTADRIYRSMPRTKGKPKKTDNNGDLLEKRRQAAKARRQKTTQQKTTKRKSVPRKATAVPGSVCIREIRRYQLSADLLIPRDAFNKTVIETHKELFPTPSAYSEFVFEDETVMALQTACEGYLVTLFEDSLLCTLHRNRETVTPQDMKLARAIRREE